jgi:hypothetical protein
MATFGDCPEQYNDNGEQTPLADENNGSGNPLSSLSGG